MLGTCTLVIVNDKSFGGIKITQPLHEIQSIFVGLPTCASISAFRDHIKLCELQCAYVYAYRVPVVCISRGAFWIVRRLCNRYSELITVQCSIVAKLYTEITFRVIKQAVTNTQPAKCIVFCVQCAMFDWRRGVMCGCSTAGCYNSVMTASPESPQHSLYSFTVSSSWCVTNWWLLIMEPPIWLSSSTPDLGCLIHYITHLTHYLVPTLPNILSTYVVYVCMGYSNSK